jgi:drug/metabolite transporter (DMT)-like permease
VSPVGAQLEDARFDSTHRQQTLTRRALAFVLGLEGAYVIVAWAWFMYSMLRLAGCWTAPCFFVVPIDVPQVAQTSAFVAFWASTTFAASVVLWRDAHGQRLQQGWGPRFVLWAALALNLLLAMFFIADVFVIEPESPFEIFLDVLAALFTLVVARLIYMVAAGPPFRGASRAAQPEPEA